MSAAAPLPPYPNGGPVGYNDPRSSATGRGQERAFAHIQDLQAMSKEGYNPAAPIPTLLDTADRGLSQAMTLNDYRRPDLAFVEFLRTSDIVVEVIPHHKDYTHFTFDQPERAQKLGVLQKKVNGATSQFMGIKGIIENNNRRTGTRPQRGQPNGGHATTESAPAIHMNGSGSAPEAHRVRPTPSPKPDNLHGRPISTASGLSSATSNSDMLSERFAKLRTLDTQQRPDSRASNASSVHSSPTSMPGAGGYPNRSSFDALSRMDSAASRPQGPRGMPNGAPAPIHIPNFPQEPPAAYSPARNMQTTGNIAPPRHSARSLASGRRTSMAPASAASAYAPNGSAQSGDYFPASVPSSNGAARPQEQRRTPVNMTTEAFIGAERFHDYLDRFNILLIDFRSRAEFDEGHIYARNVMCIEPLSIRQGMSAEDLADTLVLSPDYEQELFYQRDKFDLVVYYDNDTQDVYPFRDSRHAGLRYLHEALWDFNQEKRLQRPPILLRQGIAGWTDLVGEQALLTTNTLAKVKAGRQNIQRRPLATASISGGSQLRVPKRRLRNYEQLDADEEQSWRERARAESVVLPQTPGLPDDGLLEEDEYEEEQGAPDSAIKEFLERFPEAGNLDQQAFASQRPSRAPPEPPAKVPLPSYPPAPPTSAYPSVPSRPAPAAARMSYTGVSDRAVSASTPTARSSSSQLAPYIPPKYLATNLRLPRTGLVNFGNTCYMNSTLQALSATPPLSVFFMDDAFRAQLQRDNWKGSKGVLAELYANLIRSLWKGDVECIRPTTFRNFCRRLSNTFNNDDQQDAKEFFDFLLDTLHEDLNANWARTPLRVLTEQEEAKRERMPKLIVAKTEWGRYTHRDLSFIHGLFAGQHASKLTCLTCGFTSTTYEAFTTISVEIPPQERWSGRLPTLQDCLRSYCSEERLTKDDQWHCTRCKTTREAAKRITLTRAPQYLVVHFKRFAQHGRTARKVRVPVDFPLNDLDLSPYMLPQPTREEAEVIVRDYGVEALKTDASMTPPYRYDAYAVVRHIGQTLQAGHYVTAAKDQARKCWHWYNDKLVDDFYPEQQTRGSPKDLRSEEAYIVFYQRCAPAAAAYGGGKM
ncbi:hypothetical protein LTR85_002622 [Meristemomyces frigidus]|nr:hypothetical protein LTR85_002622 [Meristemomyces frigidus]